MKVHHVFVLVVVAVLGAFPLSASAQLGDLISSIGGDGNFESDTQRRYFNRQHCGFSQQAGSDGTGGAGGTASDGGVPFASPKSPEETTFEIRLNSSAGGSVTEVFLWVGVQDGRCNEVARRDQTQGLCAELAGNPRSVGNDFLVSGLTLQDLLNAQSGSTQIVTCESSGLRGTPYEIYAFRDQAPGGSKVDPANYGVASFLVDVEAPDEPRVNTNPQTQTSFNITWADPDPPDDIQLWNFYAYTLDDDEPLDCSDPSAAIPLGITASLNDRSRTISSSQLGLGTGQSACVFVTALDQAFVSQPQEQSNESALSDGVPVTNVAVTGFCDATGDCSGCSVSPMMMPNGRPSSGLWLLGLLAMVWAAWRLRR